MIARILDGKRDWKNSSRWKPLHFIAYKPFNAAVQSNIESALIQMSGVEKTGEEQCHRCRHNKKSNGALRYPTCVVAPGIHLGCCGNCVTNNSRRNCSFYPAGPAVKETTSEPVVAGPSTVSSFTYSGPDGSSINISKSRQAGTLNERSINDMSSLTSAPGLNVISERGLPASRQRSQSNYRGLTVEPETSHAVEAETSRSRSRTIEDSAPGSPGVSSDQHPVPRKPSCVMNVDFLEMTAADDDVSERSASVQHSRRPSSSAEAQDTIRIRSFQDATAEGANKADSGAAFQHNSDSTGFAAATLEQQTSDLLLSVKAEYVHNSQKHGAPKHQTLSEREQLTTPTSSVALSEGTVGRKNSVLADILTKADRMEPRQVSSSQAPIATRGSSTDLDPSTLTLNPDEEDEVTVHLSIRGAPADALELTLSSFEGYSSLNGFLAAVIENYDDHVDSVRQIKALRLSSSDTAITTLRVAVSSDAAESRYQRFFGRAVKDKVMGGEGGNVILRVELELHKEA